MKLLSERAQGKTFYIASSSERSNLASVRALAAELEKRGMRWTFDWTAVVEGQENPEAFPEAAEVDIEAVRSADLFVFLRHSCPSRGAHVELGVRLGVKKPVVIIQREQQDYFFYYHDLCAKFGEVTTFLFAFDRFATDFLTN